MTDRAPGAPRDRLDGATAGTVRNAIETRDPLPGTAGFAGELDGRLVRDVLGRRPLFVDGDAWAFDPTTLADPVPVPAGTVRDLDGGEADAAERHWTLPAVDPEPDDDRALAAVGAAVLDRTRSVAGEGADNSPVAVAFSGGVDSALVAAGVPDAPCYVAGFEGCHDVAAAHDAAAAMDRDLRVVEVTHDDIRERITDLVAATGRTNPMDLAIALPLFLVGERAAADGFDRLALGQGADELFGGYAKVAKAPEDPRVDAGVEPVTPLLHDDVVAAALSLPGHLLVDGDERKVALRAAARGIVPESVRTADKKAVQYGTYVARELDRLARQAGYKRRMDDHVERYVRSLVGDTGTGPEQNAPD